MSDQNIGNEDTGASDTTNQATATKTYTQDEVNDMMARMKGTIAKKFEKKYEDLGDPEELRALKSEAEQRRQAEQLKRGEFEKTLQELASKKDAEIRKRDEIIAAFKVDTPLLEEAAKFKAHKPEQVRALLKNNVRLNAEGEVEVVDATGKTRYSDKGTALSVTDLVQEFLNSNPHFVSPTPATTNAKSSHVADQKKTDITKLDMSKPSDRAVYAEYRKTVGLA